ncbi:PTS sugar transporter subunit IIC [Culicoidibacter larvae]|uniref:Permease IIC component n=1 Tax=Culicoidibacter larvae TaxID=2579976 RepID=A0A5R8Q9Z1_9FIRM|nr:PTS sugar transporter subunit IIC [Culicoidibacter larvae]TLG72736.1 PTS sugar transporter subunit IIC [Culicoidibacter larvae]
MSKFLEKIADVLAPIAYKISNNVYLLSLRDAFMLSFPLTMFGSILLIIINFPLFGDDQKTMLNDLLGHASSSAMLLMSIFVAFGIGYYLFKYRNPERKGEAIFSGAVALTAFFILTPFGVEVEGVFFGNAIPTVLMGAQGLFVSMIAAILATEIYGFVVRRNWTIKMPAEVPPAVSRSFSSIIPAAITLAFFTAVYIGFSYTPWESVHTFIYEILQKPLVSLGTSFLATILAIFLVQFFWFFGIHGHLVVNPIMDTLWNATSLQNLTAYQAGEILPNIVTKQFVEIFTVSIGSMGALAAVLVILFISKSRRQREVAKLGLAPAIFNISEPMLFGMPIILNPLYVVPWMLGAPIAAAMTYGAMAIGLVPLTTGVAVPWTMPIFFSGILATNSIMGGIMQLVELAVMILLWVPFIILAQKQEQKENLAEEVAVEE